MPQHRRNWRIIKTRNVLTAYWLHASALITRVVKEEKLQLKYHISIYFIFILPNSAFITTHISCRSATTIISFHEVQAKILRYAEARCCAASGAHRKELFRATFHFLSLLFGATFAFGSLLSIKYLAKISMNYISSSFCFICRHQIITMEISTAYISSRITSALLSFTPLLHRFDGKIPSYSRFSFLASVYDVIFL